MFTPNEERFEECFNRFMRAVVQEETNFITHLNQEEGYKRTIYKTAREICSQWTENLIGKGEIVEGAIKVFMYQDNNLVDIYSKIHFADVGKGNLKEAESILFRICQAGHDNERLFKEAVKLWGKKYATIAFLFFMQDCEKFVPVTPERFVKRFARLGLNASCLRSCTWGNYQEYLAAIQWVRGQLNKRLAEPVDLLDAHSFVWMLLPQNE